MIYLPDCKFSLSCLWSDPTPQWHRLPTTQETDGFQVKRPGDVNVKCTLLLMLDHQVMTSLPVCHAPGVFQLGPQESQKRHKVYKKVLFYFKSRAGVLESQLFLNAVCDCSKSN